MIVVSRIVCTRWSRCPRARDRVELVGKQVEKRGKASGNSFPTTTRSFSMIVHDCPRFGCTRFVNDRNHRERKDSSGLWTLRTLCFLVSRTWFQVLHSTIVHRRPFFPIYFYLLSIFVNRGRFFPRACCSRVFTYRHCTGRCNAICSYCYRIRNNFEQDQGSPNLWDILFK